MRTFILGIQHFIGASSFLRKHGLLHYYLYPLILGIVYYIGISALIWNFAGHITQNLFGDLLSQEIPELTGVWSVFNFLRLISIDTLLSILAGLIIFMISSRISKYVILIVLSPVFALLSERVDEIINQTHYPFSIKQFVHDIVRGIIVALRNLCLEMLLLVLLSLLGFWSGPFSILIAPLIWLIGAYFYGFSMLDYTCERKKMSIKDSIHYIRKHRRFVMGIGLMYALFDLIPFAGLVLGPINAVTGATSGISAIESERE